MDEALAFTGETGTLHPERRGARAQHLCEDGGRGPVGGRRCWSARRSLDLDALLDGRGGRRGLVADDAHGTHRGGGRAGRALRGGGRAGQARLRGRPGLPLLRTRSRRYSVLHAASEDLRAFRVMVVDAFVRQMDALTAAAGHPHPGADVGRAARRRPQARDRHHARLLAAGPRAVRPAGRLRARGRGGGRPPHRPGPRASRGRRPSCSDECPACS